MGEGVLGSDRLDQGRRSLSLNLLTTGDYLSNIMIFIHEFSRSVRLMTILGGGF